MATKLDPDLQQLLEETLGYDPSSARGVVYKALSPLGKIFDVADTGLNLAVNIMRPALEADNPKVQELFRTAPRKFGIPNLTFSDVLEASASEKVGNAEKVARSIAGFALDVALDPITYVPIVGTLTKTGRTAKIVERAIASGEKIAINSKVGKYMLKTAKQPATVQGMKNARKEFRLAPSMAEQADKHQRALVSIGIPFTGIDYPLVYGSKVFSGAEKLGKYIKESKPIKAFTKIFSTSSGNPKFDAYRDTMVSMSKHLSGEKRMEPKVFARMFDQIVRETKESPDYLKTQLLALSELKDYGNYSAMSVAKANIPAIKKNLVDDPSDFEKLFKGLPGVGALSQEESSKLYRLMMEEVTNIHTYGNPYTLGFRQLPEAIRSEFSREIASQAGIHTLKDVSSMGNKYVDMAKVLESYSKGRKLGKKVLNSSDSALLEYRYY